MVLQPVSSRIAYHTFSSQYADPSITPLSHMIMVGWSLDCAISIKISSKFIWSFIRFTWNFTAYDSVIFGVWMKAPPILRIVAASGTNRTLYPIYLRCISRVDRAVVLPAHGPPVRHILVIGPLLAFSLSRWLADVTIGSSMPIILDLLDMDRTSYYLSSAN